MNLPKTNEVLLLSGKKVPKLTGKYVFSMDPNEYSQSSKYYLGKLRSNFVGSFYNLYDYIHPPNAPKNDPGRNVLSVNYVSFLSF